MKNGAVDIYDYNKYVLPAVVSDINEEVLFEEREIQ